MKTLTLSLLLLSAPAMAQLSPTLQIAYQNKTNGGILNLTANSGGLLIRDTSGGLGANLFAVQSNGGGSTYFSVTATTVTSAILFKALNQEFTSGVPTCAANANAGTGASCSVAGRNMGGVLTLTTGTGAINGDEVALTFNSYTATTACAVTIKEQDSTTSQSDNGFTHNYSNYVTATTGGFTLSYIGGSALLSSTVYKFNYTVVCW